MPKDLKIFAFFKMKELSQLDYIATIIDWIKLHSLFVVVFYP